MQDEQKEPMTDLALPLSTPFQCTVSSSYCKVWFRHRKMAREHSSSEQFLEKQMISMPSETKIWLVAGVTDMRNAFNGLEEQIQHMRDESPPSSSVHLPWPTE